MPPSVTRCIEKHYPETLDGFNLKEMIEKLWEEAERRYEKKKNRAEQLKNIRACESVEKLLQYQVKAYEQIIDSKKKTRTGRAETSITRICALLSKFLESYSGIAEVIKGVDPRGGVAYGGLSIILTVARNKQEREECIGGYLNDMASWLEDLRDYRSIYQSPQLHEPVYAIYKGVFEFVLSVWEYYTGSALARLWGNIAKPAKFTLQIAAGEVQKSVGRLIAICAKLLHKTVEDSNRMIHTLHTERKDEELREWRILTMRYREILGLQDNPWTAVNYKKSLVASQTPYSDEPDLKTMQLGNKQTLENDEHFKRWLSCSYTSVLIITAINHANSPLGSDLWLSAALIDFAEERLTDGMSQVIFHPIQVNDHNPLHIVFGILCGILSLSQTLFKEHKQAIHDCVTELKTPNTSLQMPYSALFKLVKNMLKGWSARNPEKTLFILVDRLDFCLDTANRGEKEALRGVLKFLLGLGEIGGLNSTGMLKVFFLAMHNVRWPMWQFDDWTVGDVHDGLVQKLGWRQGDLEFGTGPN